MTQTRCLWEPISRSRRSGTANGITNGVLGTLTVTKLGTANYGISADFSPIGASTYTVQAYLQGVLVGQTTNQFGLYFIARSTRIIGSIDEEWDSFLGMYYLTAGWDLQPDSAYIQRQHHGDMRPPVADSRNWDCVAKRANGLANLGFAGARPHDHQ